jgi:hypothetical protein
MLNTRTSRTSRKKGAAQLCQIALGAALALATVITLTAPLDMDDERTSRARGRGERSVTEEDAAKGSEQETEQRRGFVTLRDIELVGSAAAGAAAGLLGARDDHSISPHARATWPPWPPRPAFPQTGPPVVGAGAGESPFAALLSFCTGDKFAEIIKMANLNHNSYAARHGYDFVKGSDETMPYMHFLEPVMWLKAAWGLDTCSRLQHNSSRLSFSCPKLLYLKVIPTCGLPTLEFSCNE